MPYILLFSILFVFVISGKPSPLCRSNLHDFSSIFVADSGYILKKDALKLLIKIRNEDSIDITGGDEPDEATVGKYYKISNVNYIACLLDIVHFDTNPWPVLIEYTANGDIVTTHDIDGGMYLCCWDDFGFYKKDDYYIVKSCGTGSGYCSSEIHLFKDLRTMTSGSIMQTAWSAWCRAPGLACSLTSKMDINSDTILMHYKLEILKPRRKDYKLKTTEAFDIAYINRNDEWVALDTINLDRLPY